MGVVVPILIDNIAQAREQPSRTYRLDLDRGRIFSAGSCDGLDAANQFIQKALRTPRFHCLIYDNQYGSEIKQTIIQDGATREYIRTEMPRLVRDALLSDSRILDAYGFAFTFDGESARIRFTANTVFGETTIEEVF